MRGIVERITEPQGVRQRRICGMLQALRGYMGHCVVCYRICGALMLCPEGHAVSSVTSTQPCG